MKEATNKVRKMDRASIPGKMAVITTEIGSIIKSLDTASMFGQMVELTKEIG